VHFVWGPEIFGGPKGGVARRVVGHGIKIYHLIGKIEKYHNSVRRAYEIIVKELGTAISLFNAF
jgi:hypothetical protein